MPHAAGRATDHADRHVMEALDRPPGEDARGAFRRRALEDTVAG